MVEIPSLLPQPALTAFLFLQILLSYFTKICAKMIGHIKLEKKILGWEWYKDHAVKSVFLHLLLTANYKDSKYDGKIIKRGQVVTGRCSLSEQLNLTEQNVRTALNKLKNTKVSLPAWALALPLPPLLLQARRKESE